MEKCGTVRQATDDDVIRRMRFACWITGGRVEMHIAFWWGNLRERDHLEDPGLGRCIIFRWIFRKWDVGV